MFIDEWFDKEFYQQLPLGYHAQTNFAFGQFFWTQAYYPHENLELWRPVVDPNEPTKTIASNFRIVPAGKDAFKRTFPLHAPKLETNEEFLVIRAKRRPVLLIQQEAPLIAVDNRGYRGKIQRRRCLVAQIFGLADTKTKSPEFSPTFVDRVRKMEFPQFLFLPQKAGIFEVDSLLRLDELQSVFTPHLEPTQFALGASVTSILVEQWRFLVAGIGPSEYTELRELLLKS
ncbi:MAG TPA: hypothetical protein VKV05_10655 [Terriglobales bacterium]|nr:hypothetical protein [Terriglobales bacterium]